jgi:hypothetical protein
LVVYHLAVTVHQEEGSGSAAEEDTTRRAAIRDELSRLEESAKWSAQGQFEQAKQWRAINLLLGIPASVLAAISGATALATTAGRLAAGLLALAAAAFGAVLTTTNASHRSNQASSSANAYLEIQTAARQLRLIDLPNLSIDQARTALTMLTSRRDEQNRTAEAVNRFAYHKARKNLARGGQDYSVDKDQPADHN